MRRTEKLRRLAIRALLARNRLDAFAEDLREANLPMCARDVSRYAACLMALNVALDGLADDTRDARGAKRLAAASFEKSDV